MGSATNKVRLFLGIAAAAMMLSGQTALASHMHASHISSHSSSSGHYGGGGHYHYHNYGSGGNYNGYSSGYYGGSSGGVVSQQFSGPAHIDPSQYHYFVQTYNWPSSTSTASEIK